MIKINLADDFTSCENLEISLPKEVIHILRISQKQAIAKIIRKGIVWFLQTKSCMFKNDKAVMTRSQSTLGKPRQPKELQNVNCSQTSLWVQT